jgi:hypothetical protein
LTAPAQKRSRQAAHAGASRNLDDEIDMNLIDGLPAEGFIAAMEKKYASK